MLGVNYEPTEKQKQWHEDGVARPDGGRASGKSTYIVMEALAHAVKNDGSVVEVYCGTSGQAEYMINILLTRVAQGLYSYSYTHRAFSLPNESKIIFLVYDFQRDRRGVKVDKIFLD